MKKNILKVAFVAAFAMIAGYGVYATQNEVKLSDLALDNVEALAWGEGDPDFNCRWNDESYISCVPWGYGVGCLCYQ